MGNITLKVLILFSLSVNKLHIKNEKIQIILRILLVSLIVLTLYFFDHNALRIEAFNSISILYIFIAVVVQNILYFFFTLKYPYFYFKQRLFVIAFLDVISSVYIMHLVGSYAAYYPFLLLWYNAGYSMRFGNLLGYFVYFVVIISWFILINTTPYWQENIPNAYGWLVAFIVIPLYGLRLVSELRSHNDNLHLSLDNSIYQAEHDQLTQLPNRVLFEKELHYATKNYKQFALYFIDLDGFKEVNDTHGHEIGDRVLIEVAKRLKQNNEFIARLGGDEFVAIVPYEDEEYLHKLANIIVTSISEKCDHTDLTYTASVGISLYPKDANTIHQLKRESDTAMYEAKKSGKNNFRFYSRS